MIINLKMIIIVINAIQIMIIIKDILRLIQELGQNLILITTQTN
jgi:hypothetical protein